MKPFFHLPNFKLEYLWPLTLFILAGLIAFLNWQPNVWLTGWDTLHPEFDFLLHLSRSFFGVWREDQGLGTLAAHSHMSELPRIATLWLLQLIFPLESTKLIYILTCLVLGPLGVYYFIESIFEQSTARTRTASFIGALWYLMNVGTVQHFYVVFEMFAVQFAALGWLFYLAHRYLHRGGPRLALLFVAVAFWASPMAYASLLWWVFAGSLALFLGTQWLQQPSQSLFWRGVTIGCLLILSNGYWLLPNVYFLLSDYSLVIHNSSINRLFSPEAFYHNQAYGTLPNLVLLRNFLFNWQELRAGTVQPLLQPWIEHLRNPSVLVSLTLFSLLGWSGVVATFFHQKNHAFRAMIPVFFLGLVMLINQNPPLTPIFIWLRAHLDIFQEGLRFPFTKFSLVYMLALSTFIAYCSERALHWLSAVGGKWQSLLWQSSLASLTVLLLSYAFWPAWQGHLINQKMKTDIPSAYFELFAWAQEQPPQSRMAVVPLETSAGWHYFEWGSEGPGFWWFGVPQPLLTRDFDRWSAYNESWYTQFRYAVINQDAQQLEQVLAKYDVSYLIWDDSIVSPESSSAKLSKQQLASLFSQLGWKPIWQKDHLQVYQFDTQSSFIDAPDTYTVISPQAAYLYYDQVFAQVGDYVEQPTAPVIWPYANWWSKWAHYKNELSEPIAEKESYSLPQNYDWPLQVRWADDSLSVAGPDLAGLEPIRESQVALPDDWSQPVIQIGDQQIVLRPRQTLSLPLPVTDRRRPSITLFDLAAVEDGLIAAGQTLTYVFATPSATVDSSLALKPIAIDFGSLESQNCSKNQVGTISKTLNDDSAASYGARDYALVCEGITLTVSPTNAYLLRVAGQNQEGRSLKLYLTNSNTHQLLLEELMPSDSFDQLLLIPPYPTTDAYYLSWETRSMGQPSQNLLQTLEIIPLPLDFMSKLKVGEPEQAVNNATQVVDSWKFGTHQYGLLVRTPQDQVVPGLITLSQSYDDAWLAWAYRGQPGQSLEVQRLPHHRYNGWANAWEVPSGEWQVMILYWPQLLSFLGYALLATTFVFLGWKTFR